MFDAQEVEDFADGEVDDVADGEGLEVEAWVGWADDGAGECERSHVFDINQVQRRFSVADDELSAFFERDHRGPCEQVAA